MKPFLLWVLMALVPFSTIRVVCVTTHEIDTAASAAAAEAEALECARICTHRPAAETAAPTPAPAPAAAPKMKCLITVDPGCELLSMHVFLMPQPPVMPSVDGLSAIDQTSASDALFSDRRPFAPPPKHLA